MNNLDYLIAKETLQACFDRLTTWQKFIFILWLMGWKPVEISRIVGTSRQNIADTINKAKMRLGIYYTMEKQKDARCNQQSTQDLVS